jgi:hypothetical protein
MLIRLWKYPADSREFVIGKSMYKFIAEGVLSEVAGNDKNLRAAFYASGITHEGLIYLHMEVNGADKAKTAYDIRSGKAAKLIADGLMESIVLAALEDRFCYTARMRGGDWWSDAGYMNYLSSKFFARDTSTAFAYKAMLDASDAINRLAAACQTKSAAKILAKFIGHAGVGALDHIETTDQAGLDEIVAVYGSGSEAEVRDAMRILERISGRLQQLKRD